MQAWTPSGAGAARRARALTEREAEILQRAEAGQSLRQIAADLHLSYTSVRTRLDSARRKMLRAQHADRRHGL